MPTDVAKNHFKTLMALRQQGATDDELEEYLQSVGAKRVNTRTGATGAAENLARGLALGTVKAGTSLAGAGGFLTRPVGGRRLEAWAEEQERKAERTYDPLGASGMVGQGVGRLAGEALQAVMMAPSAAKLVSAIPRVGRAARAGLEGTRLQRALSTAALSSPVDVIQGLKEEQGIVLPGRAGSVAENVLFSGAAGAIMPPARIPPARRLTAGGQQALPPGRESLALPAPAPKPSGVPEAVEEAAPRTFYGGAGVPPSAEPPRTFYGQAQGPLAEIPVTRRASAPPAAPEAPEGYVRMWHGGAPHEGGSRWLTSDKSYAEGYAKKNNGQLQYVDVPRSHPMFSSDYPEQSIDQGFTVSGEFGESVVGGLRPAAPEVPVTPAAAEVVAPTQRPKWGWGIDDIVKAKTGQPFSASLLRGEGGKAAQGAGDMAILGPGRYTTPDNAYALNFAEDAEGSIVGGVSRYDVSLQNPLVIDSDRQWRELTQRAGWEYPNPTNLPVEQRQQGIVNLRKLIESEGYDGVVVRIPREYTGSGPAMRLGPVDERTGKTLDRVFGADQVIEFKAPREAAEQIDEVAQAEQAARAAGADRPGIMDEPLERMAERMPKIAPSAARLKKMSDDQVAEMWAYYTRLRQQYMGEAGIFAFPDEGEALSFSELAYTSTRKGEGRMGRKRATSMLGAKEEGRKAAGLSEEQLGWLEERSISLDDLRKMRAAERRMAALEGTVQRLDAETERRGLDVFGLDDTSFDFGLNREGFAAPQLVSTLGGGVVGGTLGAATGDTPEERRRRGLMGLAAGAGLGLGAGRLLAGGEAAAGARGSTESIRNYNTSIRVGQRPEAARWLSLAKRLYTGIVSETFPLVQAGKELGGEAGRQAMLEQIAQSQGMGMASRQYIMDKVDPVLKAAAGKWDDVRGLLKARRDLNIRQTGGGIEIVDPSGRVVYTGPNLSAAESLPSGYTVRQVRGGRKTEFSDDEVAQVIRDAEQDPAVKEAADAINQVYRDLLKMKADAGILSQADYERILASEDFYDPFVREFASEAAATGPTGRKFAIGAKGVGRMDRTADAIAETADPLEVLIGSIGRTYNAVGRQNVARLFFDMAEDSPLLRRVDGDVTPGSRRIRQLRDGVPVTYEVMDEDLYDALSGAMMAPASANPIMRFMQGVKNVKQTGITQNPAFALFNLARDLTASGIQRPDAVRMAKEMLAGGVAGGIAGGVTAEDEDLVSGVLRGAVLGAGAGAFARPATETMVAMKNIIKNDEVYKDFMRRGGSTEGFFVRSPADARKVLEELQRSGVSLSDVVVPKRWPQIMRAIGSATEVAPRLAAYKQMLEAGATPGAAVFAAHDRTLRFANVGKATGNIAKTTAFWNAKVQGWDKLIRMLKDPRTSAAAAAAITGPTIALWSANKDNPEYWERPLWERNLFWLVPKGEGGFWRIPKPFEIGYIFASLPERLLDYAAQSRADVPGLGELTSASPEIAEPGAALTRSVGEMGGSTLGGTLPLSDALAIPVQLGADYDIFRGRRIVGDRRVPAAQQVTPESSGLSRVLAEQAGISPQQTDFVVRSTLGTLGQFGSSQLDRAIRAAGGEAPAPQARPGLTGMLPQRITTKGYSSTELETQARDRLAKLQEIRNGFVAEEASGDRDAINTYRKKYAKDLRAYEALSDLRRQMDRTAAERRAITRNVTIKPERRQELLEALRERGDKDARLVLKYRSR